MNLEDYKERLKSHDWWYEMSEDPVVYQRGRANYLELVRLSKESESHLELFEEIKDEKFKFS